MSRVAWILALSVLILLSGCESPFVRPDPGLETPIVIEFDSMPNVYSGQGRMLVYQSAYVEVKLFDGQGTTPILTRRLPVVEENGKLLARGSLPSLPPRPHYLLVAEAYEANGTLWLDGSLTFSLQPGQRKTLSLRLAPVSTAVIPYPHPLDALVSIPIPARRTVIYQVSAPTPGYYTVDVFSTTGGSTPQLECSFNGVAFQHYQPYLGTHRVAGGMAAPGMDLLVAIGNPDYVPRTLHVLVRRDGATPPDGKALTVNVNYTGGVSQIGERTPVELQFYPRPMVFTSLALSPVHSVVASQSGPNSVTGLAAFGRNEWVINFVHDVNASLWLWNVLVTDDDFVSLHRSDRAPSTFFNNWTDVTSSPPASPFPGKLDFDNPNAPVVLGTTVTISWVEPTPFPPDSAEPNDTALTATPFSYVGGPTHEGFYTTKTIHHKNDVDWFQTSPIPSTDDWELILRAPSVTVCPLRAELYELPDLVTPVAVIQHVPGSPVVRHRLAASSGDQFFVRVSSLFGALCSDDEYKVEFRLADEDEESDEGNWIQLSLTDGWRESYVHATNSDTFSFVNPYPQNMSFIALLDWPGPTYPRRFVTIYPVGLTWFGGNDATLPLFNAHQSVTKLIPGFNSRTLTLGTPMVPGRRALLRVDVWTDQFEPNDTHMAAGSLAANNANQYASIHLSDMGDWFRYTNTLKRQLRLTIEPAPEVPTKGVPVQFQVFQNDGVTPVSALVTPGSGGVSSLDFLYVPPPMPPFEILLHVQPAVPGTGAYRMRLNQRPDPAEMVAQWLFNGNLDPSVGSITFTGSGYEFTQGSQGLPDTAIHFNHVANGKLSASGPISTSPNRLVVAFWIRAFYLDSTHNGSRGFVYAQESSGTPQLAIELFQVSDYQLRLRVHKDTEVVAPVATFYPETWNFVVVDVQGFSTAEQCRMALGNIFVLTHSWTTTFTGTPTSLTIGGRSGSGTTLKEAAVDALRVYSLTSPWSLLDNHGVSQDPR